MIVVSICLFSLEAQSADKVPGFRSILNLRQRETFKFIADYVTSNPTADDVEDASMWLFETALSQGLEAEVVPVAEKFLKRPDLDPSAQSVGQQVLCLGLMKAGKVPESFALFEAQLKGVRFQAANRMLDFAQTLATQARMAGDFAASREIYERVASAFPLTPQIGEIAESKIAKLELIGQAAPRIAANDLEGKRVDWSDYADKVVLVDFWATNCPPCIAEFPNLKQLYKTYQPQGFEIIGVSLDESTDIVDAFRSRSKLPWRMVMNDAPEGSIGKGFKVKTIPALYLVDRKGKIAQIDVRGNDLRITIERLLGIEDKKE